MSRKDVLQALLSGRERELPAGNSTQVDHELPPSETHAPQSEKVVRSGAVGAMGRALGKIANAAHEARALVAAGDTVVPLDPTLIETSFIADRIGVPEDEDRTLVDAIRAHGQQVPILVRPHPNKSGHYQAAYGHRRIRAALELRLPVRAVVKEMTDTELVVAQGQENSARLNLSYIERALFALEMEKRGIDRTAIMAALSVEKTQLSRLVAIARGVPDAIIRLIGPAPKTGRPRWQALIERLGKCSYAPVLKRLGRDNEFVALDSDTRFAQFYGALASGVEQREHQAWHDPEGREIAKFKTGEGRVTLTVDEKSAPNFGSFIIEQLDELYRRYRAEIAKRQ